MMTPTKMSDEIRSKKVVLFPEIDWVKKILSPTRPHMSNVYKNIYFLFQKTHAKKKFPLANLFLRIYVFSLQAIKDKDSLFFNKKSTVRVVL